MRTFLQFISESETYKGFSIRTSQNEYGRWEAVMSPTSSKRGRPNAIKRAGSAVYGKDREDAINKAKRFLDNVVPMIAQHKQNVEYEEKKKQSEKFSQQRKVDDYFRNQKRY